MFGFACCVMFYQCRNNENEYQVLAMNLSRLVCMSTISPESRKLVCVCVTLCVVGINITACMIYMHLNWSIWEIT